MNSKQMEASSEVAFNLPQVFNSDKYQLAEKIGEGGFGQVYRATQISTGQNVAIKFLALSDKANIDKNRRCIDRFHREVSLVSQLNHPNIVQLIDKGQQGDFLIYAVYEYIEGQSLKEKLLVSGALEPPLAADVMAQVLDALANAHEKGVVHRDIKPANIMLYKVGAKVHAKVLDFGISTISQEARQNDYKSITLTQETLGTPSYSSPEQLRGEPPVPQTDIYLWGLVFLECLTGKPTISGSSLAAVFHQQLSSANIPLGILAGHESASLLRRVLSKKSSERPSNTAGLYHTFKKLSFNNLVGTLEFQGRQEGHSQYEDVTKTLLNTQINNARYSYTRLTERKQITVLSLILNCEQIDCNSSEDQDVIDTFHADQMQQCIDIAIRYGAYHVGILGDTLQFYFGYPHTTDNDSRLCGRTALELISNIQKKNVILRESQGIHSQIQVGIETGMMLSIADDLPTGKTALNSLKLSRKAKTGQILCSKNVQLLLDNYLSFKPVIDDTNKSTNNFILAGERQVEAFGFLRGTKKNNAFFGRERELKELVERLVTPATQYSELTNKPLPLVHIYGEAGIGKSRLIFELRDRAKHRPQLVAQCLPEHKNNALHPILNIIKYKYTLDILSPDLSLHKLKDAVAQTELDREQQEIGVLILSAWLSLPLPELNPITDLSPEVQKQHLFNLLAHLLCQPLSLNEIPETRPAHLFIFEDLHWADQISKDFIAYFTASNIFKSGAHSWVNTSREVLPEQLSKLSFTPLPLKKLNRESAQEVIQYLFEQQPISNQLMEVLLERTDGIPLFIEELVTALKSQHLIHKVHGAYNFIDDHKEALVPLTLRDSLQQKLDQLQHAKETAQLGATIGREFDYDLLIASSKKEEAQVQFDLEELIEAELVYKQRQVAGDSYIFKHALVRDAAYESMAKDVQYKAHLTIASAIKSNPKTNLDSANDILHYHYLAGQSYREAAYFGKKAATLAITKSAYEQCIHYADATMDALKKIDAEGQELLEINQLLITASMMVVGWASAKVEELIKYSQQLLEGLGQHKQSIDTAILLANHVNVAGDVNKVLEIIDSSLPLAQDNGQRAALLSVKCHALWRAGRLHQGLDCVAEVRRLYDPEKHSDHTIKYGQDSNIWALSIGSLMHAYMGDMHKFAKSIEEAEKLSEQLESSHCLVLVKVYAACGYYFANQKGTIKAILDQSRAICEQDNLANWVGVIDSLEGWLLNIPEKISKSISALEANGAKQMHGFWSAMLAEVHVEIGQYDQALQLIDASIAQTERFNEHLFLPKLLWLKSECFLQQGKIAPYERCYSQYLEKAAALSVQIPEGDIRHTGKKPIE
ncbi:TOMM system kinase/cyclase fusion protein [Pseudoalteromonas luteoviolacea]|uniref:TOMM system kinase/cyclase fusion protein n=1 Tax=Pseudoalteromonas luteoviolacea TaxID=43657 RepID=UPI001B397470|nr:TOMM system kinase/cyclase fusion protein [Pseudoalteromonas luteoviolacea]